MADWTAADLLAVQTAIRAWVAGGGAQQVMLGGKMVTYDIKGLRALLAEMTVVVYASEQTTKGTLRYTKL